MRKTLSFLLSLGLLASAGAARASHYAVADVPRLITPAQVEKLHKGKIDTTEQLLDKGAKSKDRKALAKFATPTVIGTLCGSAIMNAFAFASHADNVVMTVAAVAMGVAIPALIYAFTRIAADRWLSSTKA